MKCRIFIVSTFLLAFAAPSWAGGTVEKDSLTPTGQQASDAQARRAALQEALGESDLPTFIAAMDADRLLLADYNKDVLEQIKKMVESLSGGETWKKIEEKVKDFRIVLDAAHIFVEPAYYCAFGVVIE